MNYNYFHFDVPSLRSAYDNNEFETVVSTLNGAGDGSPEQIVENLPTELRGLYLLSLIRTGKDKQEIFPLLSTLPEADHEYNGDALRDCGMLHLSFHQLGKAMVFFKSCLDMLGQDVWSHGHLGTIYVMQGQYEAAIKELDQAIPHLPDEAGFALNKAICLLSLKREDEALELLESFLGKKGSDSKNFQHIHYRALMMCQAYDKVTNYAESAFNKPDATVEGQVDALRKLSSVNQSEKAEGLLLEAIEANPEEIDFLLLRSQFLQLKGGYLQAAAVLKDALKIDKDRLDIWIDLINLTMQQVRNLQVTENFSEDLQAYLSRVQELHDPAHPLQVAQYLLAQFHLLEWQGDVKAAEEKIKQAIEIAPQMGGCYTAYAQFLLQKGRLKEVEDCFNKLQHINPVLAWNLMLQMDQMPDDAKALAHMEEMANMPSFAGPQKSGILYSLAKAYEKQKDYDKAFELVTQANDLDVHYTQYNAEEHHQRVDDIIALFNKEFLDRCAGYGLDTEMPVFVLGMPRSGTTLTEQIIASHPQVFGAGELDIIPTQIRRFEMWERRLGSGLSYPQNLYDLTLEESNKVGQRLLDDLKKLIPTDRLNHVTRVVDKLPHNFETVGLIKLLFPKAKILHLVREDRDVAVSNYFSNFGAKHGGMGFSLRQDWIAQQLNDHRRLMAHWKQLFPNDIMDVVYEEMIDDVEGYARNMLEFLNLPWNASVLEYQKLDRSVKTASVWQVRQFIYKTSREKWRRYEGHLGPLEQGLSTDLSFPEMVAPPHWQAGRFTTAMDALQQGYPEASERLFQQILTDIPEHVAAHHMLGIALAGQGRGEEALYYLDKAFRMRPNFMPWLENYLAIATQFGQTQLADKLQARLKKVGQKDA